MGLGFDRAFPLLACMLHTGGMKICETGAQMRWKKSGLSAQGNKVEKKKKITKKKESGRKESPGRTRPRGKSQKLTANWGENCFSQSPKKASNSSPSGRASKSSSCRTR